MILLTDRLINLPQKKETLLPETNDYTVEASPGGLHLHVLTMPCLSILASATLMRQTICQRSESLNMATRKINKLIDQIGMLNSTVTRAHPCFTLKVKSSIVFPVHKDKPAETRNFSFILF